MRLLTACAAAGLALTAAAAQAAEVEIKDAVVRVTVVPETRNDIKVEILTSNAKLPLQVRSLGGKTIIDGNLDHKIRECSRRGGRISVSVNGDRFSYGDLPQVLIRTPRDVDIEAGGAVFGVIGKSQSLELANAGCGDWTVANIAGKLVLKQAGSGDTHVGSSGEALMNVAGSGDIHAQAVRGGLEVNVAGSGDIWVASIDGPLDAKIAGSGDLTVAGGRATQVSATVAGSGDVEFDGTAQSLKARIAGSGDVRVKAVTGEVSKAIVGSGGVSVGN